MRKGGLSVNKFRKFGKPFRKRKLKLGLLPLITPNSSPEKRRITM